MSEDLFQFYNSKRTPTIDTQNLQIVCTTALSLIPNDLVEKMKNDWNGKNKFEYHIIFPKMEFDISPYRTHIVDFLRELLSMKYSRHGWNVYELFLGLFFIFF